VSADSELWECSSPQGAASFLWLGKGPRSACRHRGQTTGCVSGWQELRAKLVEAAVASTYRCCCWSCCMQGPPHPGWLGCCCFSVSPWGARVLAGAGVCCSVSVLLAIVMADGVLQPFIERVYASERGFCASVRKTIERSSAAASLQQNAWDVARRLG
jgi:hypothetical protein